MNSDGTCYIYVHTITHEIRGSQPPDYVSNEAMNAARLKKIEDARGDTCMHIEKKGGMGGERRGGRGGGGGFTAVVIEQ